MAKKKNMIQSAADRIAERTNRMRRENQELVDTLLAAEIHDRYVSYEQYVEQSLYTRWSPCRIKFPDMWAEPTHVIIDLDKELIDFYKLTCKGRFMLRNLPSHTSHFIGALERREDMMMFKLVFSSYV